MCITHYNVRYTACGHPNVIIFPSIYFKHSQYERAVDPAAEPGSRENPIYSEKRVFMGPGGCGVQWENKRLEGWCQNCQWVAGGAIGLERGFVVSAGW